VWTGGDGAARHHVIDPTTGEPAVTSAVLATVVAGRAWRAEALATAALVAGGHEGVALLAASGATGFLVDEGGAIHPAPGFDAFTSRP
jgi:thiamine biosynthesis lipoprotein